MKWPNGSATIPTVTSEWGMRYNPVDGVYRLHQGIDLVGFKYNQAAGSGTVVFAGWSAIHGWWVWINHDNGTQTRYSHNEELWVLVGQRVAEGDIVGPVGATGQVTAAHLHFETYDYPGAPSRDPRGFMGEHSTGTAGGNIRPLPTIPEPEEEEEEPMSHIIQINDGKGHLGPVGASHFYEVGPSMFVEIDDIPAANATAEIFQSGKATPNVTYRTLYGYARNAGTVADAELSVLKSAAGL